MKCERRVDGMLKKMLLDAIALYLSSLRKNKATIHVTRQIFIDQLREMIDIITDERQLYESIRPSIETMATRWSWFFWMEKKPSLLQHLLSCALESYHQNDELVMLRNLTAQQQQELCRIQHEYARERSQWDGVISSLQQQWMKERSDIERQHQKEITLLSHENASLKKAMITRLNQHSGHQIMIRDIKKIGQGGDISLKN